MILCYEEGLAKYQMTQVGDCQQLVGVHREVMPDVAWMRT